MINNLIKGKRLCTYVIGPIDISIICCTFLFPAAFQQRQEFRIMSTWNRPHNRSLFKKHQIVTLYTTAESQQTCDFLCVEYCRIQYVIQFPASVDKHMRDSICWFKPYSLIWWQLVPFYSLKIDYYRTFLGKIRLFQSKSSIFYE